MYVDAPVTLPEPRSMTLAELDASLAGLEALFAEREGQVEPDGFGWERARKARDRSGSYQHLDWALERLREQFPTLARRLSLVYDHGLVKPPDKLEQRAVFWLAHAMPRTIRIPAWAFEEETDRMELQVSALLREGLSVSAIAERLSLRQRVVERTVQRLKAAA